MIVEIIHLSCAIGFVSMALVQFTVTDLYFSVRVISNFFLQCSNGVIASRNMITLCNSGKILLYT